MVPCTMPCTFLLHSIRALPPHLVPTLPLLQRSPATTRPAAKPTARLCPITLVSRAPRVTWSEPKHSQEFQQPSRSFGLGRAGRAKFAGVAPSPAGEPVRQRRWKGRREGGRRRSGAGGVRAARRVRGARRGEHPGAEARDRAGSGWVGEDPDWRARGVMSRPAGETLPRWPPPLPHRWRRRPGRWAWGSRPRRPGTLPSRSRRPPPRRALHRLSGPRDPARAPGAEQRPARAPAAPGPPRPGSPPPPPPRPAPRQPRGRAGAGEAPSPAARSGRPDRAAAPRAPRRRFVVSAARPRRPRTAPRPGPGRCPRGRGIGEARGPPWSSGPAAGGCCARPPRSPPAPAGTLPARAGAAARSARSTAPRASA